VSRHTLGSLLIAACALSWGFVGIIVREVDLPAVVIVLCRVGLGSSAVILMLLATGRRELLRPPPLPVIGLGILLAAHWTLYFAAIKQTSVASAVLITYAAPIFMALLAPLLIREHVPAVSVGALAVSMIGITAISLSGGSGDEAVRAGGVVLAILAAITYAFMIVLLKRWASEVHPTTVIVWQEGIAALVLSPALLFADLGGVTGADVAYLLILGIALTGLTGVLYVTGLRWVPATTAGILAYMEPVSAAVLAAVILGQSLTPAVIVGGLAIVAAGVVVAARGPAAVGTPEEPVAVAAH
jgi:drug/metabolite transporter (DMT)-like permease